MKTLSLMAALTACGPQPSRPMNFTWPAATDLRTSEINRAINDLNAKTKCPLVVPGDDWHIAVAKPIQNEANAFVAGQTDRVARTIVLSPDDISEDAYMTTLHEIGHAFGLEHHGDGIMYGDAGFSPSFDWATAWPEFIADLDSQCEN